MKLKKIHIENYKSLVDLEIIEPNPFTVFAGPNGSGKSNIFEALEFMSYQAYLPPQVIEGLFGDREAFINVRSDYKSYSMRYHFENFISSISYQKSEDEIDESKQYRKTGMLPYELVYSGSESINELKIKELLKMYKTEMDLYFKNHLRLFVGNETLNRFKSSEKRLLPDASNIEPIIKEILSNNSSEEFIEWVELFIPGFENIEIHSDNISGRDSLLIYEKGTKKPFTKNLISDGTYNILCLLAAVYQSKEPQFLCIEEPENGLNPYVVESLVSFFRKRCEENGDYIWLNTHSETLVRELKPHELILVDKMNGATKIKQFAKDFDIYELTMDRAWLTNALGGGVPW